MDLALNNLKRVDMPLKTKKPNQTYDGKLRGIISNHVDNVFVEE